MRGRTLMLSAALLAMLCMPAIAQEPGVFEMAAAQADPGNPDLDHVSRTLGSGTANYVAPVPPSRSRPDMLTMITDKSAAFSTFLSAVCAADLQKLLKSKGPITLLLPTDQAFSQMSPDILKSILENPEKCREFLLSHMIRSQVKTGELKSSETVTTAQGTVLTVDSSQGGIRIENAKVIFWDIPAKNGVIHVVDAVLVPGIQVALK